MECKNKGTQLYGPETYNVYVLMLSRCMFLSVELRCKVRGIWVEFVGLESIFSSAKNAPKYTK